tara:strand:- start:1116 stop:1373 length:258 start_codon:yes stop_codon:yes gene_type:complete
MFNFKEFGLLGEAYKDKFKIGQYVEWRKICRNENYEESVMLYQGIIINIRAVDVGGRVVWYADVMKNGGETDLILISKIRKIETN